MRIRTQRNCILTQVKIGIVYKIANLMLQENTRNAKTVKIYRCENTGIERVCAAMVYIARAGGGACKVHLGTEHNVDRLADIGLQRGRDQREVFTHRYSCRLTSPTDTVHSHPATLQLRIPQKRCVTSKGPVFMYEQED